ncbi:MAG TPA: ABC transporter permease [Candidatus Acidoferrum sp.]|nr:ABC transporter permease [Candidatus Acidoferrum sp.]
MNWWQRLLRRKTMEDQLEKEVRFHLEQHASELIAGGIDPREARRRARLTLGGAEKVKEECRDARGTRWLEDFWQDFRYALRMVRQHPSFSAVAILTLALGVGASTVMFTVVNGVLLRPLPYPQPDTLVAVHGHTSTWNARAFGEQNLAYPDFLDCQRESHSLILAGSFFNGGTVSGSGDPEYVDLQEISYNLFSVLRVNVAQGRSFLLEEDHSGAAPVMILSYSFWQRHFAGRPEALGATVTLDEKLYTVVGITPAGFRVRDSEPDVMTPLGQETAKFLQSRGPHPIGVVARLRPGATLAEAQSELDLIGRHLAEQYKDTNADRSLIVQPLRPNVGDIGSTLWLLLGAVGLVLLIACTNVASLLLARTVSRERELAMRVALGAGRGRLVRQCLTESAVLGLSGGALGVGLAALGFKPFVALWPGSLPRVEEIQLDWRVLLFALTVALLSGFLFGLAPALRAPVRELEQVLRGGGRSIAGSSRRLHSSFVVSELALAVVLLVSAGMLGHTLLHLSTLDPGVNVRNVLVSRMALSPSTLANTNRIRPAWQDVLERARRVPGVKAVATADTFPMREGFNEVGYWPTPDVPEANKRPNALATSVSPEYLKVMGIPLRRGRFFTEQDRLGSELVVVIDEVLAQKAFGGQDPIGKQLWMPDMDYGPFAVVGVVGHVRHWGLAGDDQAQVRAQFYYPFAQLPDRFLKRWSELMSIAVRTEVAPLSEVESLRRELRGVSGDQVLYGVHTMEQLADDSLALQRFLLLLFGIFAGLALVLACIGIYGVLAYLTGQRVPEIGIRIALGASPNGVMWMVLRQSLGMIFAGVVIGTAAALMAARVMFRLVEGMQPTQPSTFGVTIPVLIVAALLASFLPARRASRVDPVIALRQE